MMSAGYDKDGGRGDGDGRLGEVDGDGEIVIEGNLEQLKVNMLRIIKKNAIQVMQLVFFFIVPPPLSFCPIVSLHVALC